MAKKTVVLLEDDIDGSEANQTVNFALDGTEYEIDLNDGHANELREALERFTNAGRKVTGARGSRQTTSARKTGTSGVDAKAVRRWATENGIQVNARGRIQAEVVDAYHEAQK
ncbi:histone-like nucleoid-structuring protein Lsr2 [Arthrobacter sp. ZGTC412]|uniref:histone-like nucleoid-structuring protein Lsr2 n=1 Tax=Arthrobacter sp. ZGTC412 TaxID=2058900 RepID=UPI000CE4548C|nr:Lsr2 family protein [Arthrobacter sp. ZGTC412]